MLGLGDSVSEDGIRVAVVSFDNEAKLEFDFSENGFDSSAIQAAVTDLTLATGSPTLAATAFRCTSGSMLPRDRDSTIVGGNNQLHRSKSGFG